MRLTGCVMILPMLTMASVAWAQPQVSGRVLDHTGAPVANGRIRAMPLAAGSAASQPQQQQAPGNAPARVASAAAGVDGSFVLAGLPAGIYQICASAPGKELLDPCLLDRTPVPLTIGGGGGAPVAGMAVQLKRGATLSARVDDAGQTLAAAEKSGKGHLLVGAWSANGVFHPALITAEDKGGRTYSVDVPSGVTARVTLTPFGLRLQDAAGKAAPSGASLDVVVPPTGQTLRYAVAP